MYIKRYTVASFILIALVGWYVYAYITHETMSIDFFGLALPSLPTAAWVIVPLVVFYIVTVMHMAFYALLGSLRLRKYDKDYEKLIDAISDAYLSKIDRNHQFKTPRYKLLGSIMDNTTLFPTKTLGVNTQNEKLDAILRLIDKIKSGEVVDLKKYALKPENVLVIQNNRNRYKNDELSATVVLGDFKNYDSNFVNEVYADFVKKATLNLIEEHKSFLTKEALFSIISRVNASENTLEISNAEIVSFIDILDLNTQELIEISDILSVNMIPEQRMKLFETLSDKREDAIEAYLYTLFDLEMLSPARDFLYNTQDDEYQNFKAYLELKESGKNYNIKLFV
ncbi:MAG: hypothetical protein U9N33_04750 [Campylobacterota bacterium]|nr:hypothetical protein [Campylobacterota bacterium]